MLNHFSISEDSKQKVVVPLLPEGRRGLPSLWYVPPKTNTFLTLLLRLNVLPPISDEVHNSAMGLKDVERMTRKQDPKYLKMPRILFVSIKFKSLKGG